MITGSIVFFVVIIAIALWTIITITKFKHKLLVVFLIVLILFGYFSVKTAFDGQNVDLTDFKGVVATSGIYFSWIGSTFSNTHEITSLSIDNNPKNNQAGK